MSHFWVRDGGTAAELATILVGGPEFGPAGAANMRRGKLNQEILRLVTSDDVLSGRPATVVPNVLVTQSTLRQERFIQLSQWSTMRT